MARLFDDAASQHLQIDQTPVTGAPLTIAAWGRSDTLLQYQAAITLPNSATNGDYYQLALHGPDANNPVGFQVRSAAAGIGQAVSSTGYSVNTWVHLCGVEYATNSRAAFVNGGSKGTNTSTIAPSGVNRVTVGRLGRLGPGSPFSGDIAECAVWNAALTDDEVAALGRGYSPLLVRPDSLLAYWPIIGRYSPEIDVIGGLNLTLVSGPTTSEHPRVLMPSRRRVGAHISGNAIPQAWASYRRRRAA